MVRRGNRGFALIDSIVALAIVALALPLLLWTLQAASRRMADDRVRVSLFNLADRKLTEAAATLTQMNGAATGWEGPLMWTITAAPVLLDDKHPPDPGSVVLVRLSAEAIAPGRDRGDQHVSLQTLVVIRP